jgi:hypothetical protein
MIIAMPLLLLLLQEKKDAAVLVAAGKKEVTRRRRVISITALSIKCRFLLCQHSWPCAFMALVSPLEF